MRSCTKYFLVVLLFIAEVIPFKNAYASAPLAELEKGGKGGWLNTTRPLTADDFKGKAVLLDFWTYGCINCIQIIPDLEYMEKKFGNKLLIIGVHSAKFEGESGSSRILYAAKRFGLKHPVINDSDFAIWKSYNVNAWPTQVLLAPDGQEAGRWSGEGHREEIAGAISKLKLTDNASAAPIAEQVSKTVLLFPSRLKIADGKIYIADSGHNQVVVADGSGKILSRIGSGEKGSVDGDLKVAQFNNPHGFAVEGGKIYVADTGNHEIRLIDLTKHTVSTLAGNGQRGQAGSLASPWDIVKTGDHQLAIANAGTHQILNFDVKTKSLSVLAGSGEEDIKDGDAKDASLAQTSGLSYKNSVLYFVDPESSALRQLKDGKVKTLIGTGLFDFGKVDGKFPKARLQHAQGLTIEGDKIFVADTYNNAIRMYDLKSGVLSTYTLGGTTLNEPSDIFISDNKAYITDTNHNAIKVVEMMDQHSAGFEKAVDFPLH